MRPLLALAALIASTAHADDVQLPSHVASGVLFPDGASLTREIPFDLPPGQHRITISDLPPSVPLDQLRISVEGAALGAVSLRGEQLPPNEAPETEAVRAAQAEVERLKDALQDLEHRRQEILLRETAARAQTGFLDKLPLEGMAQDADSLRAIASMIAENTLTAEREALIARRDAAALGRERNDLEDDLNDARQRLAALLQPQGDRAFATVAIQSDAPATGVLRLVYPVLTAGWAPQYDFYLTRDEGGARLRVEEAALLYQNTGEAWEGVSVTLSTTRPSGRSQPTTLSSWMPRIEEPHPAVTTYGEALRSPKSMAPAEMAMDAAAPVVAEIRNFSGVRMERDLTVPVNMPSGVGQVRVTLAERDLDAEAFARAALPHDDVAYAMARLTLPDDMILLPADAGFYFEGGFVGRRWIDTMVAGSDAELAFGPIEGIEITRRELEHLEGGAGIISRQNAEQSKTAYTIRNLTRDPWDLRLSARVPVSTQEDLTVDWSTQPQPDVTDPEGKRGLLEWHPTLAPGASQEITVDYTLRWPRDQILIR
ncbi:MAG: hypothetical protein CSA72_02630 [Rhodobacterales bacterium]|nr:MAG: hypothetical protein CSA72_02630 [Rhodobacterales bacterium]